ncbi:hypothetical protein [Campylobacter sp.]|uniref:hypothetical protein n=2 Tax=Campylobacter TaxID=194 RepID=UPI00259CEEBC|nr:hypothetical protein [Campylobacter sp.]MBQ3167960.1 hypothetical protein [Campylobacter sp.]
MIKLKEINFIGYGDIASNNIFSTVKQNQNERSQNELAELDKSIDSLTNTSIKVNFNESTFKNQVYFKDETSGEFIKIGLSDENLEKLQRVFGKQDFFTKSDGSQILSGKAESFVAGWFGDIAYKRGYASSDANGDGYLSQDELANTNSGFTSHGVFNLYSMTDTSTSTESYMKLGDSFKNQHSSSYAAGKYASDSIEKELNKTIQNDKNSDGKIAYGEIMDKNEHEQDVTDIITAMVGDKIEQINVGEDLLAKALLQQFMGGVSSLNAEQKAVLAKAGLLMDENTLKEDLSSVIKNIEANIENSKIDFKV